MSAPRLRRRVLLKIGEWSRRFFRQAASQGAAGLFRRKLFGNGILNRQALRIVLLEPGVRSILAGEDLEVIDIADLFRKLM